ncbi:hypothetical protein PTTG_26138 [Puccinia triticina 1-1 BBBD Race 1]|uniref:Uncharacterized protein n=1 Tax=Puccinia triticina (isolate 1-1 / race 1 (BBBD)) TaxID=630390 RepID=A0A180GW70_PUCT1|nr:hypothetical protein PTTG_26138 [Puccinia triticina 1-1 BBBD Race 1]
MSLWSGVTNAKTPKLYKERFENLKKHLKNCLAVLSYLETNIILVKDLFVVAWACQYPHLRNLNTSQVESAHTYVKTFIKNSTGDLLTVFNSLAHAVDTQLNQIHESLGRDTVKTLVNVPKPFIPLLGCISTFAITMCLEQYEKLAHLHPTDPCSNTVTIGIGIPCAHWISEILGSNDALSPENFHSQWNLKYNPEITQNKESEVDLDDEMKKLTVALSSKDPNMLANILEQLNQIIAGTHMAVPIQAPEAKTKTKGRPDLKRKQTTSTKRNPSAYEIVEAKLKKDQIARSKRASKAPERLSASSA